MKRLFFILSIAIFATHILATVTTRYYVGRVEVSELFWNQMPDSLDYITSEFDYDTLIVKSRNLPITHYLDSVSVPEMYILSKRSPEAIAEIEQAIAMMNQNHRLQSLSLKVGDTAPQIGLLKYKDKSIVDSLIIPGHCYLLSFWATWCGNCLFELQPEYIPAIVERFDDNNSFHFMPICIDASFDELQTFFSSQIGIKWDYLAEITYLDTLREANEKYGESGVMPLNVVIGVDGTICYIHSGAIKDKAGLSALSDAIESGVGM